MAPEQTSQPGTSPQRSRGIQRLLSLDRKTKVARSVDHTAEQMGSVQAVSDTQTSPPIPSPDASAALASSYISRGNSDREQPLKISVTIHPNDTKSLDKHENSGGHVRQRSTNANDQSNIAPGLQSSHSPTGSKVYAPPTGPRETEERQTKRELKRKVKERKEMEKFLKLDAKKDDQDSKRESRRLRKKQPLGASSRASSTHSNKSRSSISQGFSTFWPMGPSRDKSDKEPQSENLKQESPKLTQGDSTTTPPMPKFSGVWPPRFGATISQDLATGKQSSTSAYLPQDRPERLVHATKKHPDLRGTAKAFEAGTEDSSKGQKPNVAPSRGPAISSQPQLAIGVNGTDGQARRQFPGVPARHSRSASSGAIANRERLSFTDHFQNTKRGKHPARISLQALANSEVLSTAVPEDTDPSSMDGHQDEQNSHVETGSKGPDDLSVATTKRPVSSPAHSRAKSMSGSGLEPLKGAKSEKGEGHAMAPFKRPVSNPVPPKTMTVGNGHELSKSVKPEKADELAMIAFKRLGPSSPNSESSSPQRGQKLPVATISSSPRHQNGLPRRYSSPVPSVGIYYADRPNPKVSRSATMAEVPPPNSPFSPDRRRRASAVIHTRDAPFRSSPLANPPLCNPDPGDIAETKNESKAAVVNELVKSPAGPQPLEREKKTEDVKSGKARSRLSLRRPWKDSTKPKRSTKQANGGQPHASNGSMDMREGVAPLSKAAESITPTAKRTSASPTGTRTDPTLKPAPSSPRSTEPDQNKSVSLLDPNPTSSPTLTPDTSKTAASMLPANKHHNSVKSAVRLPFLGGDRADESKEHSVALDTPSRPNSGGTNSDKYSTASENEHSELNSSEEILLAASSSLPGPASSLSLREDRMPVPFTNNHVTNGDGGLKVDHKPTLVAIPSTTNFPGNSPIKPSSSGQINNPISKMFVICCRCEHWHDMPSEVYTKLAFPSSIPNQEGSGPLAESATAEGNFDAVFHEGAGDARPCGTSFKSETAGDRTIPDSSAKKLDGRGDNGSHTTGPWPLPDASIVNCCWCQHHMAQSCCAGWTSIVYLHERHH